MYTDAEAIRYLEDLRKVDTAALANDADERSKALALSRQLTAALENPVERAVDHIYKPFNTIALNMATGLKLFEHISAAEGSISSTELSKLSGGEEALITRTLRVAAAIDFVKQTGPYEWSANATTKAMAMPPIAAGYRCEILTQSAMSARKFLESTGWKNPSDARDGLLQYANNTKLHLFEFLASQPALFADFNTLMGAFTNLSFWADWYDVEGRLLDGFDAQKSDVVLVDVGGGGGHETQKFVEKYGTKLSGSLVLQDLPGVIDGIQAGSLDGKITKMGHDFFQPQPIKGARVYFLQHILHDWSDKYCLTILKNLREAMTPGYSKLIIHDIVLPDVGASEFHSRFDLTMMSINSGMERSAREFTQLLESAGFKVTSTWSWPDKDGVVEAEVAV